jgi:hypothetical protein
MEYKLSVYVHAYIYVCLYMHTCMYVRMYVCICMYIRLKFRILSSEMTHSRCIIQLQIYVCMYIYIYSIYIYMCMCVCVCVLATAVHNIQSNTKRLNNFLNTDWWWLNKPKQTACFIMLCMLCAKVLNKKNISVIKILSQFCLHTTMLFL